MFGIDLAVAHIEQNLQLPRLKDGTGAHAADQFADQPLEAAEHQFAIDRVVIVRRTSLIGVEPDIFAKKSGRARKGLGNVRRGSGDLLFS